MPFQRTAAASSRITKPGTRRPSSSPFANAKRKKPVRPIPDEDDSDTFDTRLEDLGVIASLARDLRFSDVAQLLLCIRSRMFSTIPESGAGMNSTRRAEVLNFRVSLPPITSVAHVHALMDSPTTAEREIALLINKGVVRRAVVPGRGKGGDAVGDGLVLVDEWEKAITAEGSLPTELREKYILCLRDPTKTPAFSPTEITSLVHLGFLTRISSTSSKADVFLRPGASTLGTLSSVSSAGSSFASGSAGAAGKSSIEHLSGGSGATERLSNTASPKLQFQYTLSLPNTGSYLRLLTEAREHLMSLLAKTNRYRELPRDLLKEKWGGGIAGTDEASKSARLRGEWKGVLPGRTRKWKRFYGLEFDWVLEECVGAGMVECFQTGSVGVGVRAI